MHKTTVEIPEALATRAKRFVAASGRTATLRELIIAGLERELDAREQPPVADFYWPTVSGEGPRVDSASALALSYGLPE
ncbi:MAG: hypothetical protein Q4G35_05440 [Propionibacteriaceae bacterium]|nr:hypothetical protein [Propionibacteriaceae bacterium]